MYRFGFITLLAVIIWFACSPQKTIQTGVDAFEYRQYSEAVIQLQEEFEAVNNQKEKARISYALGKSFEKMNRVEQASIWYTKAVDLNFGLDARKALANTSKQLEQYDSAIYHYQKWREEGGEHTESIREIAICEQAKEWKRKKDKKAFAIEESKFNSLSADYAPVYYQGRSLVFTSDRESASGELTYSWTGNAFSDLFLVSGSLRNAVPFSDKINTENNEGAICFNRDFDELFFTRCFAETGDEYCKILWSNKNDGEWTEPIEAFFMEDNINYGHPTLIENDSVLVFSSNDPNGLGGYDLYYSVLEEEGWSRPDLMPESINTQGNEKFPRGDADTLYFSSDHLPGMGGLDIFKTYLKDDGSWSQPENLKPPINSGRDDFSLVVDRTFVPTPSIKKQGFFSSSRSEKSNDDIYRFQELVLEEEPEEIVEEIEEGDGEKYAVFLALRVVSNSFEEKDNPNSTIIGKKPVPFSFIKIEKDQKDQENIEKTDRLGRYIMELEWDKDYEFLAIKNNYLNNSTTISTKNIERKKLTENHTINAEILLDRIYVGKEIILDNIYYDYNKWDIREDAKPALNNLADILRKNPTISIQLASHTDCRGEDNFNLDLSQKRAQSAVSYLISQGIRSEKLQAKGFGETQLRIICSCDECDEEQHQLNRRTSFAIIE